MKRKLALTVSLLIIVLSMGLSSCYYGYYGGGPRPGYGRSYYRGGWGGGHHHHHGGGHYHGGGGHYRR